KLDADQLAPHALCLDALERLAADEVGGSVELDQPLHARDLERVVLEPHVRSVVEDPSLDPARLARCDGHDPIRLAGGHDPLPELITSTAIAQVDLVPDLGGPTGAADHDWDVSELQLAAVV